LRLIGSIIGVLLQRDPFDFTYGSAFLFYSDALESPSHFVPGPEERMNRLDDESSNSESRAELPEQPRESTPPKDQPLEVPLRRPQNFDDWHAHRRDDDPTA
jgi:hypothetical protein